VKVKMKMKRAIISAALAVAFVTGASGQDKPNFVGTWRLDPSRSDQFSAKAAPLTITVEGSKMTVTRTVAGNTQSTVLLTDGTTEKKMVGAAGSQQESTTTTRWEGNAVVTTMTMPGMTRTDKRSLQEDGTMKIEIQIDWGAGPRAGTTEKGWQVYTRVQ
jgi:hypothetical protein